jgi:PAS domain S-box-containing protein
MRDERKTKKELIQELGRLRHRVAHLEKMKQNCAQLETQLECGEKRFQSVIDNINVGLFRNTTGPKGRFIEVNKALVRIFGFESRDEVLTLNVSELYLNPEDRRKFSRKLQQKGHVRDEKVTLKKKDGIPINCSITAVSVLDSAGEIRFFDGVIEDVTEQQKAEEALRDSEKKFRNIVEASPMGMHLYELNSDDRLVFIGANQAADRILQVDNSQFIGKTIEEAFPPLTQTEIPKRYREAASLGKFWQTDQVVYEDNVIKGAYEVYAFQTAPGRMVAMFLDINTAIPIGLVINELVSNAVKHAFPNGSQGEISLKLSARNNGDRCLLVKDNGVGLPEGFDILKPETLGMQLICDLVAQINGCIHVDTIEGASFSVSF